MDLHDADGAQWTFAFHKVAPLSYAPLRNTAVVQEINGGYYAIDASLVDMGVPPPIMPLAAWLASWPPDPAAIERVDRAGAGTGATGTSAALN